MAQVRVLVPVPVQVLVQVQVQVQVYGQFQILIINFMDHKAIITKYSMTSGPKLMMGELSSEGKCFSVQQGNSLRLHYWHQDWHLNKRTATDDVLRRFLRKQASLKKAMSNLAITRDKALKEISLMDIP